MKRTHMYVCVQRQYMHMNAYTLKNELQVDKIDMSMESLLKNVQPTTCVKIGFCVEYVPRHLI